MRDLDRGQFWTPARDWQSVRLDGGGVDCRRIPGLSQTLVSGDLDAARLALAPDAAEAGLWTVVDGGAPVLVRIARDRALLVSPQAGEVAPGWRPDGFAVSPADDLYAVLDLAGPSVRDVVAEATAADLDGDSRSAALLFAGIPALLYRTAQTTARLHVEAPFADYVWQWLAGRVSQDD